MYCVNTVVSGRACEMHVHVTYSTVACPDAEASERGSALTWKPVNGE